MKKIYIIALFSTLALGGLSCQREIIEEDTPDSANWFKATIEKPVGTKSYLTSDFKVFWEKTDKIVINGLKYFAEPKTDSTIAWFRRFVEPYPEPDYTALYPAEFYSGGEYKLPSTLTHLPGNKFSNIPMWAESSTNDFVFKNIFGVLKVSVSSQYTIKSITVQSDLYMNGTFTVSNDKAVISSGEDINKTTTLDCGNQGIAGGDFFFPIPAGTYTGKNLKVTVKKTDNSTESMTTDQLTTIDIAAGTIYNFTFFKDGSYRVIESETITTQL